MRSLRSALVRLFLALAAAGLLADSAVAQLTAVTASSITMGGQIVSQGVVIFVPVNSAGAPTPYTLPGTGINVPIGGYGQNLGTTCVISNGAITSQCKVADSAMTLPAGILYNILITDTSYGNPTSGKSYVLQRVPNITGAAFALDQYSPLTTAAAAPQFTYNQGTGAPTGPCSAPSLYGDVTSPSTVQLYSCRGGAWEPASGSVTITQTVGDGSTVTFGTTAGTAAAGNDSRIVNALQAPHNVGGVNLLPSDLQTVSRPAYAAILHALHGSATAPARILVIGDSRSVVDTTVASGGGNTLAVTFGNRWVDLLRKYLQGVYGSHGTGMVPLFWGQGVGTIVNADYYSASASLGNDCSLGPSVSSSSYCGVAVLPAGSTLNFITSIPYDHLRAYCETLPSSGTLTAAIDGASAGTLCTGTSSAAAVSVGTSSAVALAAHTAVLTCAAGGGGCPLYAMEGVAGTSGVSVDNASVGGAALGAFASNPATQFAFSDAIPEGEQLVIELHHTNEPGIQETTTQFQTELNNIINHERALALPPSIELVALAQDNDNISGQAPFYPIIASTAAASATGYVDVRNRTGTAFDATLFGPDGIHENNAGAANNYAMISAPFIDMPTPVGASGGNGASGTADITGGTIDGTVIGGSNPSPGTFTTLLSQGTGATPSTGINFQAAGVNTFEERFWGTGNQAGLAGAGGLFDLNNVRFVYSTNANDDFCLYVPVTNVSNCQGALFVFKHDGTVSGLPASGGGFTPGAITVNNGAALLASPWPESDDIFMFSVTPSATISAGSQFALFTFGKTWYNPAGTTAENPLCSTSQFNAPGGALLATYTSTVSSTQVGFALVSGTMNSGTTYFFYGSCKGHLEK